MLIVACSSSRNISIVGSGLICEYFIFQFIIFSIQLVINLLKLKEILDLDFKLFRMEWHVFKIISNTDDASRFLLNCRLKNFSLNLNIIQNTVAWSAEINQESLEALALKLKMNSIEYLKKLKEHLNSDTTKCEFNNNNFILQYNLSNIKIKYFHCKLTKVVSIFECVGHLMQTMFNEKNNMTQQTIDLENERNLLVKKTTELETKLIELTLRKKKDEDVLYSNFVLVLNEKKARIQHLTELLQAFRNGRPTVNPQLKHKRTNSEVPKVNLKNEVSESDSTNSEAEYNTDDESIEIASGINIKRDITSIENVPSSSKNCSTITDDWLSENQLTSYILPKRVKYENSVPKIIQTPISVSSKTEMDVSSEENSPVVSYSTQDLLNDI